MSTSRLPPDYYEEPEPVPPPPPRRNWKKIVAWLAAAMMVISAGLLIAAVALMHNIGFRQYLLGIVYQRLNEATGVQLRMKDFSLHFSGVSPAVDMYDVVVDGAAPYVSPPLLQVDHLSVSVQVISLLQKTWYLKDIVLDHPVARVIVDQNGETNLPKSKTSGESQTSVFDLGIRHVMLGRGEVYYNDRQSIIDADLHDLQFQSSFDTATKRYTGGLSYHNGQLHVQNLNTIVHNLEAEFDATPDSFTLKRSTLTSGASQFTVTATLNDYVNPRVNGTYQALLDSGELRQILKDATLPVGVIKLAGSAAFQIDPKQPLIQTLTLDGNVSSDLLKIQTAALNTEVRDISAAYKLQKGDAEVRDLRVHALGGALTGSLKMRDVAGAQVSEFHAVAQNISLPSIQKLANSSATQDVQLGGTANAKIDARWRKSLEALVAHTDATFNGTIAPTKPVQSNAAGSNIPLVGEIHAQYVAASQQVSFTQTHVQMPQTTLTMSGTVGAHSSMQVQFQSTDLHEVETAAAVFVAMPEPLGLAGTASFAGSVRGSTAAPQITGQLSAAGLKVKGTEWRTIRASVDASPSHVALRNGDVVPANNRGHITLSADVSLNQWAFLETSPIQADVNATQLNIEDLKNLAGSQAPVSGIVSANLSLHGSQLNPIGQGTINVTQLVVADEPIQTLNVNLQGTGDEVHANLALRMTAGAVQGAVTYFPKRKAYDAQLDAPAIRIDQFRTVQARNLQVSGTLKLNAQGSGTVDDPAVQLTAQIPQLQIQNQTISGLNLQVNVANQVATVALDSQAMNTFVKGHGKVNLTGDYETDATIDTSRISFQPILAAYMPAQSADITGQTELHATVKGPLKDITRLDAHATIPTLSVAYKKNIEFSAAQPVQVDYSKGVLTVQRTRIQGTGTDLQVQGTIPVNGATPISLLVLGTLDLRIAEMLSPDVTSSGQLQFDINGYGLRLNPNVQGQIKIVNANFAGEGAPLGLQDGNGVLNLTNDRLEIQDFHGKVGSGTVTAKGGVTYRPTMAFNLSLVASDIRLLYPQGVREGVDTNFTLTGSTTSAVLRGQVRLNELSFSPSFDLNDVAAQASGTSSPPPQGFARNLQLDITVQSTNDLNLASSKLSLQGAANIRVRGTAAEPVVLGRVNINGGDLIFRGSRYLLQPSTIEFVNPYKIEPRMNLSVDTTVQQYNIHMLFRGTMDQLRTTYSSDPALPPSDIINLLVFGKTTEAAAANPTPGNMGAQSMIASSLSGQLTNRLEKIAGISQLSIDPVLGGGQQDTGARVTIQQRVTGNLFVTFASDATSTQRQVIKLEYQATPRVSLSGVRDQNGGMAVDVRIKRNW